MSGRLSRAALGPPRGARAANAEATATQSTRGTIHRTGRRCQIGREPKTDRATGATLHAPGRPVQHVTRHPRIMSEHDCHEPDSAEVRRIGSDAAALDQFYRRHLLAAIDSAHLCAAEKGTPEAWLLRIAFRVVRAEQRRRARHRKASNRAGGRRELALAAIGALEQQIDAQHAHAATVDAFRALPLVNQKRCWN